MASPSAPQDDKNPTGSREKTGRTTSNAAHHRLPRLPHERDESADSQELQEPDQRELIEQAHDDLERGLVDTDKGPVLDKVYRDQVKTPRGR